MQDNTTQDKATSLSATTPSNDLHARSTERKRGFQPTQRTQSLSDDA